MENLDPLTLARRSVHGVVALISRNFALQLISLFASVIIFSLLSKEDIGVYTVVIAVQRIISFITDFGIGAALIQREKIEEADLTTSFTIQFGITLLVFVLIFIFQGQLRSFFGLSYEATLLLLALVATIVVSSFKTIPSILLERKIHFQKLIFPQIVESLTFNSILIALVIQGFELRSYTIAFLVSSLLSVPFYYYVSPWKVRLGIRRRSLEHLKFGIQYQAKNILATVKDDFLTVFLAKILTFVEISYIGFAQRFSFMIFRYVVDSVTKVTFSTYSRIQSDSSQLKTAIEKSLFFVSLIMFPVSVGLIITAPYIIDYFPKWDNKWEGALFALFFFSLNAMVSALSNILVNVLDATGRVKTTLRLMVLWTILTWILTPLFIMWYGYSGVAIAAFVTSLTIVITIRLVKQAVEFNFMKSIYKPLLAVIAMALFTNIATYFFVQNLISLIIVIVFSGVFYSLLIYALAKDELLQDLKMLR